jgi:hypothetical protein
MAFAPRFLLYFDKGSHVFLGAWRFVEGGVLLMEVHALNLRVRHLHVQVCPKKSSSHDVLLGK